MKISTGRKVRMGASIAAALTMGAISIISSATPTRAEEVQLDGAPQSSSTQKSSLTCGGATYQRTYVFAYAFSSCPYAQVQTAIDCNNSGWIGYKIGRSSTADCPSGGYRVKGAARVRLSSSSAWGRWYYNP